MSYSSQPPNFKRLKATLLDKLSKRAEKRREICQVPSWIQ